MKKVAVIFCLLLLTIVMVPVLSVRGNQIVTFRSLVISEDGQNVLAHIALTDSFADHHDKIYLFRVTADHDEDLSELYPVYECTPEGVEMTISLPYRADDPSQALSGYVLARAEDDRYIPLSDVMFPSNFADFAPHTQEYPIFTSKKGLQVQLSTDAQLLGVKHTVVNAFLNELITDTDDEDIVSFVYGGKPYYLRESALSALDYRIRTLTEGGIHVYLNVLLAFDSSAPSDLYYPNAKGNTSTLFAPNVSTEDGIYRYAAVMNYLAARYSNPDGAHGFCGSYIIGYEVNQAASRHNTGTDDFSEFVAEYATLLRTANTAVRSAYQHARLYVSLSNRWEVPSDQSQFSVYGGKDLLTSLADLCPDIPFGVSINPYPSSLSMTDYWNDEKAVNAPDTAYLTMKNLSVLTDFLATEPLLFEGNPRRVVVGEFGVSGKPEETEDLQAAAYLYAYYTVLHNDAVEALIWHRHVDHAGEMDLYYGLYASSEFLLEPTVTKKIYSVFAAVDHNTAQNRRLIDSLIPLLPDVTRFDLYGDDTMPSNRVVYTVTPITQTDSLFPNKSEILFDFSKSLYHFYPTDNAEYLEQIEEDGSHFMRIKLIPVSSKEYMGAGGIVSDMTEIHNSESITLRLRATSPKDSAELRLLLVGNQNNTEVMLDASSVIPCGEWVDVTFPLSGFTDDRLSPCNMKIWLRTSASAEEDLYLDVASVSLVMHQQTTTFAGIFLILAGTASLALLLYVIILIVHRVKKQKSS